MAEIVLPYDRTPEHIQDFDRDLALLNKLLPHVGMVKLGLESMTANVFSTGRGRLNVAAEVRRKMSAKNVPVLWDMKLHDIGNTMSSAVRNLSRSNVNWVTVHASASANALKACAEAARKNTDQEGEHLRLFGVTVLTDIDAEECEELYAGSPTKVVTDFAKRLIDAGIDGIVCSGRELEALASKGLTQRLKTLVPGLRSGWASTDDQKRVMTPAEAASMGADYLVIGRQIMAADDPIEAARRTREEIDAALPVQ